MQGHGDTGQRLADLGERQLIRSIVSRHLGAASSQVRLGIGDDAAVFAPLAEGVQVVATVDACPTPVVDLLGVGSMYDWGRLAGVISLSDLAAMGATPLGLLSSTYMSPTMPVKEYEAYLVGLSEVCAETHSPIVGGNVREGASFAATTVALGTCARGAPFNRSGAAPTDIFIAIGHAGVFWSAVLELVGTGETSQLDELQHDALFRPKPKLAESHLLGAAGVVTAAVDCSDGLGAGIEELCVSSGVGATIRYDTFPVASSVARAASQFGIPLERLLLSWGDWQLLVTVRPRDVNVALQSLHSNGHTAFVVGEAERDAGVFEEWKDVFAKRPVTDTLASLRFEASSYLQAGLDGYIRRLKAA